MRLRALHFALVWLMALALPFQAVAATAMRLCAPAPVTAPHGAPAHSAHGAHHLAQGENAQASPAHHAVAMPAVYLSAADVEHQCSACATCSAGAAFPVAEMRVPVDDPARDTATPLPPRDPSVVLRGLERPPRNNGL